MISRKLDIELLAGSICHIQLYEEVKRVAIDKRADSSELDAPRLGIG